MTKISNEQLIAGRIPDELLARMTEDDDTLDLSECRSLISLPENLPAWLTNLNLGGCKLIDHLPENLPAKLTYFNLGGCKLIDHLPENLPAGLTHLSLMGCKLIDHLPENLPAGLIDLGLPGCTSIGHLPENLPEGLTDLELNGCTSLTHLPENLPAGLTYLGLRGCRLLTLPENLPAGLTRLDLYACQNLVLSEALIRRLSTLEEAGVYIEYPAHFNLNDQSELAKRKLREAIVIYKSQNLNEQTSEIEKLLHRFLTEEIKGRGGVKMVVQATSQVLDLITANPNHLKWIEIIAGRYLEGCVNQPVAGWSEISAIMSIAIAPEISDKVEAAKYLMILYEIKLFISKLPKKDKPGEVFEAEFGNTLLREVQKKLIATNEIKKPWLGVPQGIASEEVIAGKMTQQVIEGACERARKILAKPLEEIAKYLCEGYYQNIWAEIAFPQEVAALKQEIMDERIYLGFALEAQPGLGDEEVFERILESIFDGKEGKEARDKFKIRFNSEREEFSGDDANFGKELEKRLRGLSIAKRWKVVAEVSELTNHAISRFSSEPAAASRGAMAEPLGQTRPRGSASGP